MHYFFKNQMYVVSVIIFEWVPFDEFWAYVAF